MGDDEKDQTGTGTRVAEKPPTAAQRLEAAEEAARLANERADQADARAHAAEERAQTALETVESRMAALEARLSGAPVPEPENDVPQYVPTGQRGFVNPQAPEGEYLIAFGKVLQVRDPNSPTGYRDHAREGDIKVTFHGGVWVGGGIDADPDDNKRIAWLEAHPEIARDVQDPMTPIWFEIKAGQVATSRKEAAFSGTDVDAALAGDINRLGGSSSAIVEDVRKQLVGA